MTGYLKRIRRKTSDQYQQAFISECQLYLWQPKHHCSLMTEILVPYVLQLLQKSNLCDRDEARTMQDPVSPKSADLQGWLCWGQLPRGGDSPGESPDIDSPIGSHWSITNRFFMISCWVLLICRRLTVTWCWLCLPRSWGLGRRSICNFVRPWAIEGDWRVDGVNLPRMSLFFANSTLLSKGEWQALEFWKYWKVGSSKSD